ncbi:MAG: hypothetical protein PHW74_12040 [Desulfobacca sp.]|nr:hypothetical protein [Desulfobacca sp.]
MKNPIKFLSLFPLIILLISGFTVHGVTLGKSTFSEVTQKYAGGQEIPTTPQPDPWVEALGVKKIYTSADQRLQFWFNAAQVLVGVVETPKTELTKSDILAQYPGIKFEADISGSLCLNAEVSLAPGIFKCIKLAPDGDRVLAITISRLPSQP